jgi:hypothetical protein
MHREGNRRGLVSRVSGGWRDMLVMIMRRWVVYAEVLMV